jgi:hypothetical protein
MNRLTFRILMTAFMLLVSFCLPSIASADGVTWTLSGVTFGDWTNFPPGATTGTVIGTGGSASGSFFYDATLGANGYDGPVNVSTTPWATLSVPTIYMTVANSFAVSNSGGLGLCSPATCGTGATDLTNISLLFLVFTDPLTNAGGTMPISLVPGDSLEELCLDAACDTFDTRPVTGGEVSGVATPTPEPAAFLLLGIGLLALLIGSATRKVVSV